VNEFTTPSKCDGLSPVPNRINLRSPLKANSVLNFDAPFHEPISLFGSFIPVASAQGAPPAPAAPTPLHPVYVYDDLYVYGNSDREPGNLFLNGQIVPLAQSGGRATLTVNGDILAAGTIASAQGMNFGSGDAETQIAGPLQVLGTTMLARTEVAGSLIANNLVTAKNGIIIEGGPLNVTGASNLVGTLQVTGNTTLLQNTNVGGTLTVTGASTLSGGASVNGPLNVNGTISAPSIGQFYRMDGQVQGGSPGSLSVSRSCGDDDILISCQGRLTGAGFRGTQLDNKTCTAYTTALQHVQILNVQAVCFNPNRSALPANAIPL
jgi:hypothetical protein